MAPPACAAPTPGRAHARSRLVLGVLAALALAAPAQPWASPVGPPVARAAQAGLPLPAEVNRLLRWVQTTRDNEGASFVIIDKPRAHLWLFDAQGGRLGHSPVLLGQARGDASVPGIGEREMALIRPHERTTPAGRFIAEPGHNASGEDIFWVDYDAAVSMHRVRATNPAERRLQRLATPSPLDNRISYGCINVPAAFYDRSLRPTLSGRRGVVYLLPETLPLERLFNDPPPATAPARARPMKEAPARR